MELNSGERRLGEGDPKLQAFFTFGLLYILQLIIIKLLKECVTFYLRSDELGQKVKDVQRENRSSILLK